MSKPSNHRMSRLRKNISWNFATGIASIFGLLLLYPLAVRISGAESYGIWVLAFGAIQLFSQADFGLGTGVVRTLSKISPEASGRAARRRFVTVAGILFVGLALLLSILCFVFLYYYLEHVSMSEDIRALVPLVVTLATGSLFIAIVGRFANAVLWAEDRLDIERKAALLGLIGRAVGLSIGLHGDFTVVYVMSVEALSIAIPSLICCVAVFNRYGMPSFDLPALKLHTGPLVRVSSVLFIGTFTSVAATQIPLYIVGSSLGLTATTAFGAIMRVFQSTKLAVSWLTNPFTHVIATGKSEAELSAAVRKCFLLTIGMAILISIPLVTLPRQFLSVWMGEPFAFAAPSLGLLAVAVVSNALILPSALISTLRASPWPTATLGMIVMLLTLSGVYLGAEQKTIFWATLGLVFPLAVTAPAYVYVAYRQVRFRLGRKSILRLGISLLTAAILTGSTAFLAALLPDVLILGTYGLLVLLMGGVIALVSRIIVPRLPASRNTS